jgi:dUTPase
MDQFSITHHKKYTLFLYSEEADVRRRLHERAAKYADSGDSGFDLEVYGPDLKPSTSKDNDRLCVLSTRVHAKVICSVPTVTNAGGIGSYEYAVPFTLAGRSSLPFKGHFLGNCLGIIDARYCDDLRGIFVRYSDLTKGYTIPTPGCSHVLGSWRNELEGERCVQVLRANLKPFDVIKVVNTREHWDQVVKDTGGSRGGGLGSTG